MAPLRPSSGSEVPGADPSLEWILCRNNTPILDARGQRTPCKDLFPTEEQAAVWRDKAAAAVKEGGAVLPGTPEFYRDEKIIGVYFSAHWCPPCRQFTPQLKRAYNAVRDDLQRDFEVLFVSWDNDYTEYEEYAAEMPWKRLPFNDPRGMELRDAYRVSSIPTLVTVRARDGKIINRNARSAVPYDIRGTLYPWPPGKRSWWSIGAFLSVVTVGAIAAVVTLRDRRFLRPKV